LGIRRRDPVALDHAAGVEVRIGVRVEEAVERDAQHGRGLGDRRSGVCGGRGAGRGVLAGDGGGADAPLGFRQADSGSAATAAAGDQSGGEHEGARQAQ